jgi:two-component system sensor histidine kinase TctE
MSARAVARTGLPAAMLAGAMLVGARVREARRTEELNRGLHELRRPLQTLALATSGSGSNGNGSDHELAPAPLDLAICALSDLDRTVNGGPRLSRRRLLRPRPVVEAALRRWAAVAEPAGEAIGFEWRAGTAAVVADPDRIAQALDNLLANAFEHGTVPVRVGAVVRGRHVRIAVEDRGARAPRSSCSNRKARRRRGLEIVSEIAREHGGRFALDRGPRTTTAVLELPLASLPVPASAPARAR